MGNIVSISFDALKKVFCSIFDDAGFERVECKRFGLFGFEGDQEPMKTVHHLVFEA